MNRIIFFASRRQSTWVLWMLLGTPFVLLGLLLDALVAGPRQIAPQWKWEWRYEVRDWFARFTPHYRGRIHSLACRPAACGAHWRKEE